MIATKPTEKKALGVFAALVCTSLGFGQSFEAMGLSKDIRYAQRGANLVVVDPEPVSVFYGGPYGFSFGVEGEGLSGITPPVISGPITVGAGEEFPDETFFNGGTLVYNNDEDSWNFGINGDDWGSPTKAALDAIFGTESDYTLTVGGVTFSLSLSPEEYANAPRFTLTGGEWVRGRYHIAADAELTISTNTFLTYGNHVEDVIWLNFSPLGEETLNFASENPTGNSVSVTVPANTMQAGRRYELEAGFIAVTDTDSHAAFPDALIFAGYEVSTLVEIVVTPIPTPVVVPTMITPVTGGVDVSFHTVNGAVYTLQGSNEMEIWYNLIDQIHGDGQSQTHFFAPPLPAQYFQVIEYLPLE